MYYISSTKLFPLNKIVTDIAVCVLISLCYFQKEEWVVCRVFKKSQIVKMRHTQDSPDMDSPCNDANASLGELGELDVCSMLGSFAPAAAHGSGENFGHRVDMGAYISWLQAAANQNAAAMLPWAPGLLGTVFAANPAMQKTLAPFAGSSQMPRDVVDHALFGNTMAKADMECEPQQQLPQLEMHDSTWRTF